MECSDTDKPSLYLGLSSESENSKTFNLDGKVVLFLLEHCKLNKTSGTLFVTSEYLYLRTTAERKSHVLVEISDIVNFDTSKEKVLSFHVTKSKSSYTISSKSLSSIHKLYRILHLLTRDLQHDYTSLADYLAQLRRFIILSNNTDLYGHAPDSTTGEDLFPLQGDFEQVLRNFHRSFVAKLVRAPLWAKLITTEAKELNYNVFDFLLSSCYHRSVNLFPFP